jgi:hypothetical protein
MNCLCRLFLSATALSSSGLVSACLSDVVDAVRPDGEPLPEIDWDAPIVGADDGRIRGDVGPARGIDNSAEETSAWDGGTVVSVENVVVLPERVVMVYASITGAKELLRPGTKATFLLDDRTGDGPSVVLLGCTGREPNIYDEYDAPADAVDVDVVGVDDGPPGAVDVAMTGHWGDQSATSTFRLFR